MDKMKCLTVSLSRRVKNKDAKQTYFSAHRRGWLGLGDAIPNKFCPVYTQGGTCSTNCDFNGAPADLGRPASENERILMKKDAIAISRYQWEGNMDDFCKTECLTNFPYAPLANSLVSGAGTFLVLRYPRNEVECITSQASYP